MHAIIVEKLGGPEVLQYRQVEEPGPLGPGEALIKVSAIGVNYIDTYFRRGLYPSKVPFTPGLEGTGVIVALGDITNGFEVGQQVSWCDVPASYAEFVVAPVTRLVRVDPNVSAAENASFLLQGLTTQYLVRDSYAVTPGNRVLIHAGAGGMGLLLTQACKKLGAYVVTTVSTPEKQAISLAHGADNSIIYHTAGDGAVFADEVRSAIDGELFDLVYDGVGAATFLESLTVIRPRGTMVLFGQASGPVAPIDPQILQQHGSLFLTRPALKHFIDTTEELQRRADDLNSFQLSFNSHPPYPLKDAAVAHADLEARRTTGSVVLIP